MRKFIAGLLTIFQRRRIKPEVTAAITIDMMKDFSRFVTGRKRTDGKFSGEYFREEFIIPALESTDGIIEIYISRLAYASFLDEAFGGLVAINGYDSEYLLKRLKFRPLLSEISDMGFYRDYSVLAGRLAIFYIKNPSAYFRK